MVESLEEEKYYTITDPQYTSEWLMVGKVSIGNNGDNSYGNLRGKTHYRLSKNYGGGEFHTDIDWCYKDNSRRSYRLSTPEEIHWLEKCKSENMFVPLNEALKDFNLETVYPIY